MCERTPLPIVGEAGICLFGQTQRKPVSLCPVRTVFVTGGRPSRLNTDFVSAVDEVGVLC